MNEEILLAYLQTEAEVTFSRSSGPGGQNVNKTNTKVLLRVVLDQLPGLTEAEKLRLREKTAGRLTSGGELVIQVQDDRSQLNNRTLAVSRMLALIKRSIHLPKLRRPTKPTRSSQERRLAGKKADSRRKADRNQGMDY